MTPEEAREIDRLEFEADCRAARERAHALVAERRSTFAKPNVAMKARKVSRQKPSEDRVIIRRSNARRYVLNGKSMTISEWSAMSGHSGALLRMRMRSGMSFEQAVTTPKLTARVPWQQQIGAEPGVGKNFPDPKGTGGGCRPQDIPQIEIFPNDRTY